MTTSYQAKIISALNRLGHNGTANPDAKHNAGNLLGDAFLWDEVVRYAKGRSDAAWDKLEAEGLITRPTEHGEYALAVSPSFTCTARVSQPVKRFNADELAALLKARYKIPEPAAKELIEKAKLPGKPAVTFNIAERSS